MKYVHVGINVTNLEASIEFYQKVFGASPVKVKEDYAKFLLDEPRLNFTLNIRDEVRGNQVNHFGFHVDTQEEISSHKTRLEKEGFFAREEMDTTCCYAVQDKFWVTDPDGNEWEFFYTKSDSEVHKNSDGLNEKLPVTNACC
ncbi:MULTISPECIES: ArsI/CadI family heavy metal resistance metalloenzyme [Priestia]|uniref:ArsI/CadI family heavy metal resistance metalloenzyme n=1 Tax=Priestia TaxID=2800373 RepID=UPI00196BA346|nr:MULTISPECIES: ArsI/CadI family heavy metal resistance metalloenzyme [Priestia]MCU7712380.1 glyoxalase/bleomycin resistance/dioxygenase family protein [Priestia megaterium]MCW1045115.1 glyoxalase/bleomycin resistance/dioxygenase family protein [Priestia sp. JV24]QSF40793.1 glyoxalase/bleomycin resistance/dioxygenase family protein [Priestia megaterium]